MSTLVFRKTAPLSGEENGRAVYSQPCYREFARQMSAKYAPIDRKEKKNRRREPV